MNSEEQKPEAALEDAAGRVFDVMTHLRYSALSSVPRKSLGQASKCFALSNKMPRISEFTKKQTHMLVLTDEKASGNLIAEIGRKVSVCRSEAPVY